MAADKRGTAQVGSAFYFCKLQQPDTRKTQMPKMKTKSSAKKRFKVTATGKVMVQQAGKQHGMIKRSNDFIRKARGMAVLSAPDAKIVKKFMPYQRGK
jgi:large subunit ribosomal protein L35